MGEPQLHFNYVRAMTDYMATFVFGRGVQFKSPHETSAIVPSRLKRVWEVDNDKRTVLWELAQQGGVSGDAFIKVAYLEPSDDPNLPATERRGRVKVLVLNSQHCFPEWSPHDRTKLIRFKLTYKFWGSDPGGTRQVYTYTEIMTDSIIEEYINDQMIRQDPNPLGCIPVVHIPNVMVSGSPWGLPDCYDILDINRQYNETAVEINDIINYHAAPITVVLGAKVNNLERGAKKIWALPGQNVDVKNLQLDTDLVGPLAFLDRLKVAMHEMTGIPETALGQAQPISNTSGVALAIQFQPLMQKWHAKVAQYAVGLEKVNEYILLTLFLKEPEVMVYNPDIDGPINVESQVEVLDPEDPLTYQTEAYFPPPLPIDKIILLNELSLKQAAGLESRVGMLQALGEEFPEAKLEEIRAELLDDVKADGAMQLIRTLIQKEITELTGMLPGADGAELPPLQDGAVNPVTGVQGPSTPQMPNPILDPAVALEGGLEENIRMDLVTQAYGPKTPKRRSPDQTVEGERRDD